MQSSNQTSTQEPERNIIQSETKNNTLPSGIEIDGDARYVSLMFREQEAIPVTKISVDQASRRTLLDRYAQDFIDWEEINSIESTHPMYELTRNTLDKTIGDPPIEQLTLGLSNPDGNCSIVYLSYENQDVLKGDSSLSESLIERLNEIQIITGIDVSGITDNKNLINSIETQAKENLEKSLADKEKENLDLANKQKEKKESKGLAESIYLEFTKLLHSSKRRTDQLMNTDIFPNEEYQHLGDFSKKNTIERLAKYLFTIRNQNLSIPMDDFTTYLKDYIDKAVITRSIHEINLRNGQKLISPTEWAEIRGSSIVKPMAEIFGTPLNTHDIACSIVGPDLNGEVNFTNGWGGDQNTFLIFNIDTSAPYSLGFPGDIDEPDNLSSKNELVMQSCTLYDTILLQAYRDWVHYQLDGNSASKENTLNYEEVRIFGPNQYNGLLGYKDSQGFVVIENPQEIFE